MDSGTNVHVIAPMSSHAAQCGLVAGPCQGLFGAGRRRDPEPASFGLPASVSSVLVTKGGAACPRGGGAFSTRSTSTSDSWPVQPWASAEVPRSRVTALGLPARQVGGPSGSSGSNQAPVESWMQRGEHRVIDRAAAARQAPRVVEEADGVARGDPARGGIDGVKAGDLATVGLVRLHWRHRSRAGCGVGRRAGWR